VPDDAFSRGDIASDRDTQHFAACAHAIVSVDVENTRTLTRRL
jgi:hypothetical protein